MVVRSEEKQLTPGQEAELVQLLKTKRAELADKLKVDMIIMSKKGIGKSTSDLGHVTQKVLKLTSKPVVLLE